MRKLLAALLLFVGVPFGALAQGPPTGPPYIFPCTSSFASSFTAANSYVTIVAGVAGKGIYICGWHATTTNTNSQTTFQLFQSQAVSGGASNVTTTASSVLTPPIAVNFTSPAEDHQTYAFMFPVLTPSTSTPYTLYLNSGGTLPSGNPAGANLQIIVYFGQY